MPDNAGFDIEMLEGSVVVSAPRTLDAATQPAFTKTLNDLAQCANSKIRVDLSATEFLDSAGVGFIVKIHRQCETHSGTIEIKNAKGQPLKLLQSLEVNKHINLVD